MGAQHRGAVCRPSPQLQPHGFRKRLWKQMGPSTWGGQSRDVHHGSPNTGFPRQLGQDPPSPRTPSGPSQSQALGFRPSQASLMY